MLSSAVMAAPALRVKRTITLSDGSKKEVVLCGDENFHFYLDAQDNAYTSDDNVRFVKKDKKLLTDEWAERLAKRNEHRLARAEKWGLGDNIVKGTRSNLVHRAEWGAEQNPISGEKKGLVILVNFADKKFNTQHDHTYYDGFFNTEGFSEKGAKGSVHDYFLESSYGKFDLSFDVFGPVTVSQNMSYYGQNQYGADAYPAQMVSEACKLADQQGADFSKYDWDGDGVVDQVFVVYAGYGEHMGAPANTIWPHESTLADSQPFGDGDGPVKFDGVWVDTYAVTCELFGTSGTTPAGIGTACHEFSHCMCVPDMYDTDGVNFGMGPWDLMDFGSYSGTSYGLGDVPAPYTSYERMYCGWLTPTELSTPCVVEGMKPINAEPQAYIIYNEKNRDEYYLLENRQPIGFSASDANHGLLMLHVWYDKQAWNDNSVNTGSVQHMTIIPADNTFTMESCPGDTWPGTSQKTDLTETSTPAATLYTANVDGRMLMGKDITDITENEDGTISFLFAGGVPVDTPVAYDAKAITGSSFTANWSAVDEAVRYEVQLTSADKSEQSHSISEVALMEEDFSGFNNGTQSNGVQDISGKINNYTKMDGWEGSNLYTTPRNEVRIGNQKSGQIVGGNIISPWLTTVSKVVTVCFIVRSYSTDKEPVYLLMGEGNEGGAVGKVTPTKDGEQIVVTASSDTNEWWWGLSCDARCYVSEMNAYEGHLTEEEIASGYTSLQLTDTKSFFTDQTSYTFSDLSADKKYSYSVKAYTATGHSAWSNKVDVELSSEEDVIEAPSHGIQPVDTYDLAGRKLNGMPRRGFYIMDGKKFMR